jgi:hypothetical protein
MTERKKITIGIACDGFSFTIADKRFWFSQEEEQIEKLWKKIFKELDIDVIIEEEY